MVVLDSVQFTKNDWRNRNRLIGANGPFWLTIPVKRPRQISTAIDEIEADSTKWQSQHVKSITSALRGRPFWEVYEKQVLEAFETLADETVLSTINLSLMSIMMKALQVRTPLIRDRSLGLLPEDRNGRLAQICKQLGAESYLTGPAGLEYLDNSIFEKLGVRVEVFKYPEYGPYRQRGSGFDPFVSVLDYIANNPHERIQEVLNERPLAAASTL